MPVSTNSTTGALCIEDYIQSHPDQFAKRRLYQIEQISFPAQKDMESLTAACSGKLN